MDRRMMNAWLQGQAQKAQITEAQIQRKRLGVVPQAEARSKGGECATSASTPSVNQISEAILQESKKRAQSSKKANTKKEKEEDDAVAYEERRHEKNIYGPQGSPGPRHHLDEQLSSEEEAYAKEHKSMLKNMVDQYGQEKGTRVFYATVRNKVRGK